MDKINTPKLQDAMNAYLKGSYETAFNMFCELAFDNNGRAMYFLGKFYEGIPGVNIVKQRYELRDTWYKLGASRGDALATLAYIRAKLKLTAKNGISIKVFNNCFETVRTTAIEGDAFAKMEMYYTYSDASIYEDCYKKYLIKDYKEEFKWLREAAEAGSPEGMVKLGTCYDGGYYVYGVVSEYKEAIRWYQKAAELGDVDAMLKLGTAYEDGLGVEKNYGEASRWYQKAYDSGWGHSVQGKSRLEKLLRKCGLVF